MTTYLLRYQLVASFLVLAGAAQAQLLNGNFATGDFTGWTVFTTPYGATTVAGIVPFDTAGTGQPSSSAQFEVGVTSFMNGGQGAGIYQYVTLGAGQLTLSLDIAATSSGVNADAGTFELLLDGTVVNSHAFGVIYPNQTLRSALDYTGPVGAGTHQIAIEMLRGYGAGNGDTPYQYLANVQLSVAPVPEPSALGITTTFGALFLVCRRRFIAPSSRA